MEFGADARQMAGFKPFYQFAAPTRVIAGEGLVDSAGFEFTKENASRPMIVTDAVLRETGLVDRVSAGVADGGLEVAGVFDDVPQDSDTEVVERAAAGDPDDGGHGLGGELRGSRQGARREHQARDRGHRAVSRPRDPRPRRDRDAAPADR